MTFLPSASASTIVPRASRMNLLDRLIMPWRLPAAAATTLPVAVILNRFLAADFVFILGILLLQFCIETADEAGFKHLEQPRHALPDRSERALITAVGGKRNGKEKRGKSPAEMPADPRKAGSAALISAPAPSSSGGLRASARLPPWQFPWC